MISIIVIYDLVLQRNIFVIATLKQEHQGCVTPPSSVHHYTEHDEDNQDADGQDDPVYFLLSFRGIGPI